MTDLDILRQQTASLLQLIENEKATRELAKQADEKADKALQVANEAKGDFQHASDYCALGPYATRQGFPMHDTEAAAHGRAMTRWCKALGIAIERVPHKHYVDVHAYPKLEMNKYFTTHEFHMIRENFRKR